MEKDEKEDFADEPPDLDEDEVEEGVEKKDTSQFQAQVAQKKKVNSTEDILDEVRQKSSVLLEELVGNFSSALLKVAQAPNIYSKYY
jgi:hypothetical protein